MPWEKKDWNTILQGYSSGEDSDEHDDLNLQSIHRNAQKISDLMAAVMPGAKMEDLMRVPTGMNSMESIREGLYASMLEQSRHLRDTQKGGESTSSGPSPEEIVQKLGEQIALAKAGETKSESQTVDESPEEKKEEGVLV